MGQLIFNSNLDVFLIWFGLFVVGALVLRWVIIPVITYALIAFLYLFSGAWTDDYFGK